MKPFVLFTCIALSLASTKIHGEETISINSENLETKHCNPCHHGHSQHRHRGPVGPTGPKGNCSAAVFSSTYTIDNELGQEISSTPTPLLFETPITGNPTINYPAINSPITYTNSGLNAGSFTLSSPGIYLIKFSGLINYQQGAGNYGSETLSLSLVNTTTSQVVNPSPIVKTTFTDQSNAYDLPVSSFSASNCVQIVTPQTYQIQGTFTTETPEGFLSVLGIDNTLLNIILLVPF